MSHRFTDLHCKEVICICDGRRLGYVSDAIVELPEGRLGAIVVPAPCRLLGVLGHRDDFIIPWNIHVCNYNFRKDSKQNFLKRKKIPGCNISCYELTLIFPFP